MPSSIVFTKALNPGHVATSSCLYECYPDDADCGSSQAATAAAETPHAPEHQPAELRVGRREIRIFQLEFLAAGLRVSRVESINTLATLSCVTAAASVRAVSRPSS